ncbi:MAG TPA: RpiB/LacA/LacB family sugar-phosphate isomerase [Patescibacteria group bacterium]|nr:RpiB/LacA/LacB family sugar-phosphate isomerase [Patescibacteria group bacterium]
MVHVILGADHRGYHLKEQIKTYLTQKGFSYTDFGAKTLDPNDDYVDIASAVSREVQTGKGVGILLCGSGVGVDITANKFPGIRCGLVFDIARAKQSREHEDINILALAADVLSTEDAKAIVDTFLITPFSQEERHTRRLQKLHVLEK